MRLRRWLAPETHPSAVYHCVSRVVDRRFIFGDWEKQHFRKLMLELAEFCQVRILTFCIMSNHFHILVEVPRPPFPLPDPAEALAALSKLSGCQDLGATRRFLQRLRDSGDTKGEARWLAGVHARRWRLSPFLQLLKQRFSSAYNRRHGRKGTLWEERFRSVLVEGAGRALVTMAAYIDLNPVRAGLVQDPKDYRWSGYGNAVAGSRLAREGITRIAQALLRTGQIEPKQALAAYRCQIYRDGARGAGASPEGNGPGRVVISREAVLRVLVEHGRVSPLELLHCRVRHFCDGAVFGSRRFVDAIFRTCRSRFGNRRTSGARPIPGLEDPEGLCTVRDLKRDVFT